MLRSIVNIDPITEIQNISNMMDRMFGPLRQSSVATDSTFALPVDIYERDNTFYVRAAVPGVSPEELDVQIADNVLTIKGETKHEWENNDAKVYHREYRYGSFSRSIRLPENLNLESVDAEFQNGFVTISIPRVEPEKPRALKVNVRSTSENKPVRSNGNKAKEEEPVGASKN